MVHRLPCFFCCFCLFVEVILKRIANEPDEFMYISAANGIENCKLCVLFILTDTNKRRN